MDKRLEGLKTYIKEAEIIIEQLNDSIETSCRDHGCYDYEYETPSCDSEEVFNNLNSIMNDLKELTELRKQVNTLKEENKKMNDIINVGCQFSEDFNQYVTENL